MKKLLLLAIVVLGISAVSFGQDPVPTSATETAKTSATIIVPISITHVDGQDLLFGKIMVDNDGGTVTVPLTGSTSYTGLRNQTGMAGTTQPATFTVHGEPGATFSILKPDNIEITKEGDATKKMTVNDFQVTGGSTGTLDVEGKLEIKVGATLIVDGLQESGTYKNDDGLFITVAYN